MPLIEKQLRAVIFRPPNAESFFKQSSQKSIKDKEFSSRPLLLIIASLKHCLAFWILVRLRTKLPKRGSESVLAWLRRVYQ